MRYYVAQLTAGIKYCHERHILHRDLKLGNIFLGDGLRVKIADFGLSNTFAPTSTLKSQCGTPVYMAPEMLQRHSYTTSVDVWSAGIVLYIILSGSMPFYAENPSVRKPLSLHSFLALLCVRWCALFRTSHSAALADKARLYFLRIFLTSS